MKANRRDDSRNERTARAMAGAASPRRQAKLHKKLTRKERERLEEQEDDSGRQTRRKRFINPEKDFGKKSLVYQLKYGVLKNEVPIESLQQPVRPRPRDDIRPERSTPRNEYRDVDRREPLPWEKPRSDKPSSRTDFSSTDRASRPRDEFRAQRSGRRDNTRDTSRQGWEGRPSTGDRFSDSRVSQQSSGRDVRERRPDGDRDSPEFSNAARKMMPMAIKYTTAASQFLLDASSTTYMSTVARIALIPTTTNR
ncbi:hypothetical protein NLG97_g5495 [Lecanicillium saksenae]|uniref:Uncharacterized protein n=1 Tax=Lecanicillium saksenae TaxID=468837 RepID=A0ACC1QTG8_9HYPO|nr:hypothetical protein NLG97_g5495 [Lecanicillium saksenae]